MSGDVRDELRALLGRVRVAGMSCPVFATWNPEDYEVVRAALARIEALEADMATQREAALRECRDLDTLIPDESRTIRIGLTADADYWLIAEDVYEGVELARVEAGSFGMLMNAGAAALRAAAPRDEREGAR